jgi:hypothetical protein
MSWGVVEVGDEHCRSRPVISLAFQNGGAEVLHGGGGHGLTETRAGGVIFIVIGKALSLAGGVGINLGKRLSSIGGTIVSGVRWRGGGVVIAYTN